MSAIATEMEVQTLRIEKQIMIDAPREVVFQELLQPHGCMVDLGMKLEPWPGGRWYRDLGDNTGHVWGHVQVIKPPGLLELTGPMMMSYPAISHVQYRLTEESGQSTKLVLIHQAMGLLLPEHVQHEDMDQGWEDILKAIAAAAEQTAGR